MFRLSFISLCEQLQSSSRTNLHSAAYLQTEFSLTVHKCPHTFIRTKAGGPNSFRCEQHRKVWLTETPKTATGNRRLSDVRDSNPTSKLLTSGSDAVAIKTDHNGSLFYSLLLYFILFYSTQLYFILFYSILFSSILSYSIIFCSIWVFSIMIFSVELCSVVFCYVLFPSFLLYSAL